MQDIPEFVFPLLASYVNHLNDRQYAIKGSKIFFKKKKLVEKKTSEFGPAVPR